MKDKEWLDKALLEQSFDVLTKKGQENEAREILEWAFNKLSPEDKIVLELIYLEGFSNKEASDLLGWDSKSESSLLSFTKKIREDFKFKLLV